MREYVEVTNLDPGPDPFNGPVIENAQGGRQSASPYLFRGLPPKALRRIARVLKKGAHEYEPDPEGDVTTRNWHKISSAEHLEHLILHLVGILEGDESDDHPGHLATRAMFYLHQHLVERQETP